MTAAIKYIFTDGENTDFVLLCRNLDQFLNQLVGGEENWSEYINYSESVIVDEIKNTEQKDMPQIKLKAKAKAKIGQRELVTVKEEKTIQKVQNE